MRSFLERGTVQCQHGLVGHRSIWDEYRDDWSDAVGELLDTQTYLDRCFELYERRRVAEEMLQQAEVAAAKQNARAESADSETWTNSFSFGSEESWEGQVRVMEQHKLHLSQLEFGCNALRIWLLIWKK